MNFWVIKEKLKENEFPEMFELDNNEEGISLIKLFKETYSDKFTYKINGCNYSKFIPSSAIISCENNDLLQKVPDLLNLKNPNSYDNCYNISNRVKDSKDFQFIGKKILQNFSIYDIFDFLTNNKSSSSNYIKNNLNEERAWSDFINNVIGTAEVKDIGKELSLKIRSILKKGVYYQNFHESIINIMYDFLINDYKETFAIAFCSVYNVIGKKSDIQTNNIIPVYSGLKANNQDHKTIRFALQSLSILMKREDRQNSNSVIVDKVHNAMILFEILFSTKNFENELNLSNLETNEETAFNYNYLFNITLEFFYNRFSNNLLKADLKVNSFQQKGINLKNLTFNLLRKEEEKEKKKQEFSKKLLINSFASMSFQEKNENTKKHLSSYYSADLAVRMLDYFGFNYNQKQSIFLIFDLIDYLTDLTPSSYQLEGTSKILISNINYVYDYLCSKLDLDKNIFSIKLFSEIFSNYSSPELVTSAINELCEDLIYIVFLYVYEKIKLSLSSVTKNLNNDATKYVKVLVLSTFTKNYFSEKEKSNNSQLNQLNPFQEYLFNQVAFKSFNKKYNTGKPISRATTPEIKISSHILTKEFYKLVVEYINNDKSILETNGLLKSFVNILSFSSFENSLVNFNKNDFLKQTFVLSKYYSGKDSYFIFNCSEFILNNDLKINKLFEINSLLGVNAYLEKPQYMHEADSNEMFDNYKAITISEKLKDCSNLKSLLEELNLGKEKDLYEFSNNDKLIKYKNPLHMLLEQKKSEFAFKISQKKLFKVLGTFRMILVKKRLFRLKLSQIKIKYYFRKFLLKKYGKDVFDANKFNSNALFNNNFNINPYHSTFSDDLGIDSNISYVSHNESQNYNFNNNNYGNFNYNLNNENNTLNASSNNLVAVNEVSNNNTTFNTRVVNPHNKSSSRYPTNKKSVSQIKQNLNNFDYKEYTNSILTNAYNKAKISSHKLDYNLSLNLNSKNDNFCFKNFDPKSYVDKLLSKVNKAEDLTRYISNNDNQDVVDKQTKKKANYKFEYISFSEMKANSKGSGVKCFFEKIVEDAFKKFDIKKQYNINLNTKNHTVALPKKDKIKSLVTDIFLKIDNKKINSEYSSVIKPIPESKYNNNHNNVTLINVPAINNVQVKMFYKKEAEKLNIPRYVDDILRSVLNKKAIENRMNISFEANYENYSQGSWKKDKSKVKLKANVSSLKNGEKTKSQKKVSVIDSGIGLGKGKIASKRKSELDPLNNRKSLSPGKKSIRKSNINSGIEKKSSVSQFGQFGEFDNKVKTRQSVKENPMQKQIKIQEMNKPSKKSVYSNSYNNSNMNTHQSPFHGSYNQLDNEKDKPVTKLEESVLKIQNKFRAFRIRNLLLNLRLCSFIIQRNFRRFLVKKYDLPDNYFFNEKYLKVLNHRYTFTLNKNLKTLFPLMYAEEYSSIIKKQLYELQIWINSIKDNPIVKQEIFSNKITELSNSLNISQDILLTFYSYFINNKFKNDSNLRSFYYLRNLNLNVHDKSKIFLYTKLIDFELQVDLDPSDEFDFASEYQILNDYNLKNNTPIKNVSLGGQHCLITNSKGRVFSFGWNNEGQCGVNVLSTTLTKEQLGEDYLVDANEYNELVVKTLHFNKSCKKDNPYENFNSNLFGLSTIPESRSVLFDEVVHATEISCGDQHSFVLDEKGDIWAFGDNSNGELGLGNFNNTYKPSKITVCSNNDNNSINNTVKFSAIKSESHVSFAISTEGNLYMWPTTDKSGNTNPNPVHVKIMHNDGIQIIQNMHTNNIPPKLSRVIVSSVSCGNNFAMICSNTGLLYSFGKSNIYGQLGHGDTLPRNRPILIEYFLNNKIKIDQVACGFKHVIVKSSTDKVFAWGLGIKGQLGGGDYCSSALPQQISSFRNTKIYQVAAGFDSSYFLIEGRKLYGCGGKASSNIPLPVNYYERYPEISNDTFYSIVKIYCVWNKIYSVLYATVADTRTMKDTEVYKTNKLLNELSQKWNGDSSKSLYLSFFILAKIPYFEALEKYFPQNTYYKKVNLKK